MKKTWIALTLAGVLCVPLAGCAGNKTGSDVMPGTSPTTQVTPNVGGGDDSVIGDPTTGTENPVDGDTIGGQDASDSNATNTQRSAAGRGTGRANDSALEQVGEGIKDTLDDLGADARRMAQNAKRTME